MINSFLLMAGLNITIPPYLVISQLKKIIFVVSLILMGCTSSSVPERSISFGRPMKTNNGLGRLDSKSFQSFIDLYESWFDALYMPSTTSLSGCPNQIPCYIGSYWYYDVYLKDDFSHSNHRMLVQIASEEYDKSIIVNIQTLRITRATIEQNSTQKNVYYEDMLPYGIFKYYISDGRFDIKEFSRSSVHPAFPVIFSFFNAQGDAIDGMYRDESGTEYIYTCRNLGGKGKWHFMTCGMDVDYLNTKNVFTYDLLWRDEIGVVAASVREKEDAHPNYQVMLSRYWWSEN